MNVLILANNQDGKNYQNILKTAPNTNVLGVVKSINEKFLKNIKSRYNPHILLIDESVNIPKKSDLSFYITSLMDIYPHCQTILFTEHKPIYDSLGLYAVISGSITNVDLYNLIENAPVSVTEISGNSTNIFYNKNTLPSIEKPELKTKEKTRYKYNNISYKKYIITILIIVVFIAVIGMLTFFIQPSERKTGTSSADEVSTITRTTTVTTTNTTTTNTIQTTTTIKPTTETTKKATTTVATTTVNNNAVKSYVEPETVAQPVPQKKKATEVITTVHPSTAYVPPPTKTKRQGGQLWY